MKTLHPLSAAAGLLLCPALLAQGSVGLEAVADLDPAQRSLSSRPSPGPESQSGGTFAVLNGRAYFAATTALGRELARCGDAVGSAALVKDLVPGPGSSGPEDMVPVGNQLFFTADDGVHGRELWVTDGSAAGTRLVADLTPGAGGSRFRGGPSHIDLGGRLLFVCDAGLGDELYISDGTSAGTTLVADINPGAGDANARLIGVTPDGAHVLFSANDGVTGEEPWITDGTAAGTQQLADLVPGGGTGNAWLGAFAQVFGSWLYYGAKRSANELILCRTDGVTNEIVKVFPATRFSFTPRALATFQGRVWWLIGQDATGQELWTSDGTDAGTVLFADLMPGTASLSIAVPGLVSGDGMTLYFDAGQHLIVTDGTAVGTTVVSDVRPRELVELGGQVLCRAEVDPNVGAELYAAHPDGTLQVVRDILPGPDGSGPGSLTALNGSVVFAAEDRAAGREVFVTDGTAQGTVVLEDIEIRTITAEAYVYEAASAGSRTFFSAEVAASGEELWVTDGTLFGTRLVRDIAAGPNDAYPYDLAAFGDDLLFTANDEVHGEELWYSDGTAAGTRLVADIRPGSESSEPYGHAILDGFSCFAADDGVHGFELWRTDGTTAGTRLVTDIVPGANGCDAAGLTSAGRLVFFSANDGVAGSEVWCTDGTAAGTRLVADLVPGSSGSSPRGFQATRDGVLFLARGPSGVLSLWSSDGQSVTELVATSSIGGGRVENFVRTAGGRIYLLVDVNRTDDLWMLDGTQLTRLSTMPRGARLLYPRACGERVVVRDFSAGGLVVSDGTLGGTLPVAGVQGSLDRGYVIGETLYFSGYQGDGSELWATDGTVAGTRRVVDLWPGADGSNPDAFLPIGGDLAFLANTPSQRGVLYALRRPGANVLEEGITCGAPAQGLSVTPPVVGQTMTIDAAGRQDATSVVVLADFVDQGFEFFGCTFYVNPGAIPIGDALSRDLTVSFPVPNDSALLDASLVFQAIWIDGALQLQTSKGVRATFDDK